jgi:hypothetical protein
MDAWQKLEEQQQHLQQQKAVMEAELKDKNADYWKEVSSMGFFQCFLSYCAVVFEVLLEFTFPIRRVAYKLIYQYEN